MSLVSQDKCICNHNCSSKINSINTLRGTIGSCRGSNGDGGCMGVDQGVDQGGPRNKKEEGCIRSRKQDDFDGASNIVLPCPGS